MLLVAIAFAVLMLMGMPVAFAIGISGALFFAQHPELPFTIPVQVTVSQTQNFALLAVPLFIMAGNFMNKSGITERLLELALVLTGRLKGGLAQVSLALAALMGGVSGSAIADAAMQSRMLGDELVKRGFTRGFAAGVLSFGSVLTPIVPPGIGMILYGTIGQVSIGRLFAAGFVPAVLLWCGLAGAVWLTATRRGYRPSARAGRASRELGRALRGGIWALLFPVFLLLGLRMGVFTPSEIGAFAVVYAVVIGLVIHRKLGRTSFRRGARGKLRRRRRGRVPDRALGDLQLRDRARAHPGARVRLDPRPDGRSLRRDGADRALRHRRRVLRRRHGSDHHADPDLPAARAGPGRRPGPFRASSSSSRRPSATSRRRSGRRCTRSARS